MPPVAAKRKSARDCDRTSRRLTLAVQRSTHRIKGSRAIVEVVAFIRGTADEVEAVVPQVCGGTVAEHAKAIVDRVRFPSPDGSDMEKSVEVARAQSWRSQR